jgi:hypothetical protein
VRVTGRKTWVLTLATAGFLALMATIPAQALAAPRTSQTPSSEHCNNVEFIGARGSGQPYTGKGSFGGLGPEVSKMVSVIKGQLGKKRLTYGTDAVGYPAVSVNVLKPSALELMLILDPMTTEQGIEDYINNNLAKFMGSINTGVNDTIFDASTYHSLCPSTVFVLVGYSQGAMVMHAAETSLDSKRYSGIFKKIAGTVLLADGFRVPRTKAHEFGTSAASGEGVTSWLLGPGHDVPLPGTTANICDANDIVCNFSKSSFVHFSGDAKVHTTYAVCNSKEQCTYKAVLTTGATFVGNAVIKRLG